MFSIIFFLEINANYHKFKDSIQLKMRHILFLFLLGFLNSLGANDNYFDKLYSVNKEWTHYEDYSPKGYVEFETDSDAIQAHLLLVCKYLKENPSKSFDENQLSRRTHLIERLEEYALNKVFPTNSFHSVRTPYFVDIYGVYCAVGFLMKESGYTELVAKIKEKENFNYIKDIQTEGVTEWAEEYGFTLKELKWIQPSYAPSPDLIQALEKGTNGPVHRVSRSSNLNGLIIAGDFDSLNLEPCLNIGIYQNNQLSCLGGGVSGKINDMSASYLRTVLFGHFDYEGDKYTMAIYDEGNWSYLNIPTREGYVATAGFDSGQRLEVAIHHPDSIEKQEIWIQPGPNSWNKELEINGFVRQIGPSVQGRIFAGHFSQGITFDDQGTHQDTVYTKNVIFRGNHGNNPWLPINGTELSDTVNAFVRINNQIYFAGSSSGLSSSNNIILTRYMNNTFQPILFSTWFGAEEFVSIDAVEVNYNDNSLIIGGDFIYYPMIGTGGRNLAYYNIFSNSLSLIGYLNNKVNTIATTNNDIYFGGDFTKNLSFIDMNHIGRVNTTLNAQDESAKEVTINVYPNPFTSFINVENANADEHYKILDSKGKLIEEGKLGYDLKIDLSSLPKGVYFLNLRREKDIIHKKIVKD